MARRQVDCDWCDEEADRRRHAGAGRADDPLDAELAGDAVGMDRAGAAECDHGQRARVDAEIRRVHGGRLAHGFVDEVVDSPGAALDADAEVEAASFSIARAARPSTP